MRACLIALATLAIGGTAQASDGGTGWWQKDWPFRKLITLDGSPKGANITQPVGRTPLLVRLHDGNFVFKDAKPDGSDVRFVGADGKTPLAHHIESFDAQSNLATIWVDVSEVPVASTRPLSLYYGNKTANAVDNAAGTFDPDYKLVYHFEAAEGTPPRDATANGNNGLTSPSAVDRSGIAGAAGKFNGVAAMTVPASASMNTEAGGAFTFSAWLKPDALQPQAVVYSRKGDGGSVLIGLSAGTPYVEINGARLNTTAVLSAAKWNQIAVTADGTTVTAYLNGRAIGNASAALPALSGEAGLGGEIVAAGIPGFVGSIDEVRISGTARSAALLYSDFETQNGASKLVVFGEDEKQSSGGFGILGIIIKNVDHVSWAVIGVMAILALLSWWVMATKIRYIVVSEGSDDDFLEAFRTNGDNPLALADERQASMAGKGDMDQSPIYRVYRAGADEIRERVLKGEHELSGEGQNVIRALMDAKFVRENQKLGSGLVWLTLAISGGPFLGLLGTVVGVMFTFAAIAAAGDVNINAIAPGISAALLATVTGMFVAIPALFGYNYILLRNKNLTANMQVFVDEFVTRVAEAFSRGQIGRPAE